MSRFNCLLAFGLLSLSYAEISLAANTGHEDALRATLSNLVETAKDAGPSPLKSNDVENETVDPKSFDSGLKLSLKASSDPMPEQITYSLQAVSKDGRDTSSGSLTPGIYELEVQQAGREVLRKQFIAMEGLQSALELSYSKVEGFALRQTLELPQLKFAPGQKKLVKPSFATLKSLSKLLQSQDGIELFGIEVHTDTGGVEEKNEELTLARAIEVRNYLVKSGVDAQRIRAQGFGSSRPMASNDSKEGRIQNRRVEYVIMETSEKPRLLGDR